MSNSPQSIRILFLLFLILLFYADATSQPAGKWRIKNRLQVSYEFDNNIRENPSDTFAKLSDSSLRFLFHSRASRSNAKTGFTFSYQGGLQSYFQYSFENKLINEAHFSAYHRFNKMIAGVRGNGRLKLYLNDLLDYSAGSVELFFKLPVLNFSNEFALRTTGLDYQNFSVFNYLDKQFKWTISKKIRSRWTSSFELSGKQINYDRNLVSSVDSTIFQQEDFNTKFQFHLNYAKSFLINLNYSFENNDSNSFLFDYQKHQFVFIFGIPLPNKIWLRSYGTIQIKNYSDESTAIPTDVDTEREESNFFVLDISRDISPGLSSFLRFGYYNNESIIRSRFYKKVLITTGFDFRF